ncbi:MAG TPA: cytochrome P450 [Pseudonocardiaceae bacterium]
MNRNGLRFAFHGLSFLKSHEGNPAGVIELRERPTRQLLVWHPDGIRWIFRPDRTIHHVPSRTLRPLLGHTSLLWAQGPRHTAYRQVLGPPLRGRQLQVYHGVISDTVHDAISALAPRTAISLISWVRKLTFTVISTMLLGHADDQLHRSFSTHIDKVLGSRTRTLAYRYLAMHPSMTTALQPFFKGRGELDAMLLDMGRASTDSQPPALATLLLKGTEPLTAIDDDELRDQIKSLLFAGHETTASATAWTLYLLCRDEQVRHDIMSELAATSDDGSDAAQVPLLHAAAQEAMRLFPPAIIAGKRALTTDGELLGRPLPKGSVVTPCMYLAHRQPELFPRPHRFDPSRFLGPQFSHRYYFPFGGGVRRCLGSELAMLEVRMITAAVLRRCELHCVNPEAGVPELRGPALTLAHRLQMAVTPRRRPRNRPA